MATSQRKSKSALRALKTAVTPNRAKLADKAIVVIDVERQAQAIVADVLVHAGYRVTQAHNGHAALELLRTTAEAPRLALVDMFMPVMDGLELVEQLRSDYAALPVVMLSAEPHDQTEIDGVAARLQKPIARDELLDVIVETLRLRERAP